MVHGYRDGSWFMVVVVSVVGWLVVVLGCRGVVDAFFLVLTKYTALRRQKLWLIQSW